MIVGGGIAGCATAYYLRQCGLRAVIVERDGIGAHASGLAYGGLNPLTGTGIPGPMYPLAQQGFALHAALGDALDVGLRRRATVHLAFTAQEAEDATTQACWMNAQPGFHAQVLDPDQARAMEARLSPAITAATVLEGTAEVDALRLTRALAEASGAEIRKATATALILDGDRAQGVRLDGESIASAHVVLAQGPWLDGADWLGVSMDIAPLKGEILRLRASGPAIGQSIGWAGNYLTTKPDQLLWAGTTEQQAGFDATPSDAARRTILARVRRMLPGLEGLAVVRQTACLRPVSADGLAVLGPAPNMRNVYIADGGGRKGILYGPAMGAIIARLIADADVGIDIAPFAPGRFRGSPKAVQEP